MLYTIKVKDGGKYVSKAVYTIFGIRVDDKKEVLGLYLLEAEGANFSFNTYRLIIKKSRRYSIY